MKGISSDIVCDGYRATLRTVDAKYSGWGTSALGAIEDVMRMFSCIHRFIDAHGKRGRRCVKCDHYQQDY